MVAVGASRSVVLSPVGTTPHSHRHTRLKRIHSLPQVESKEGGELKPSNRSRSTLLVVALAVLFITFGVAGCPPNVMAQTGGTFTVTGNMTTARAEHTATLLKNGKVLIAGGGSPELYDPLTRTFTAAGNGTMATSGQLATLLNDGRVLFVGVTEAELYDPAIGTFARAGNMSTARYGHSATLLNDGNVLIAGGIWDASSASAEVYDPSTGTFTTVGNMIRPRPGHTATLLNDGRVLIAGGNSGDGLGLNEAELYDPSTRTFFRTGNMGGSRQEHTATLLNDGTVLIAGGVGDTAGWYFTSAELYVPSTGSFVSAGDMNGTGPNKGFDGRADYTATLLRDGRVLLAGSVKLSSDPKLFPNNNLINDASAEIFDPATRTFSLLGKMTAARSYHSATLLSDGTVLIAGGAKGLVPWLGGPLTDSAELFTPPSLRPPASALPKATRDFNGDGKEDIVWRDTAGNVSVGLMDGSTIITESFIANIWTGWSIVGSGDFNGDRKSDILWHDVSGNVAIWLMDGMRVAGYSSVANMNTSWTTAGIGETSTTTGRRTSFGGIPRATSQSG